MAKQISGLRKILAAGLLMCLLFTGLPMTATAAGQDDGAQGGILGASESSGAAQDVAGEEAAPEGGTRPAPVAEVRFDALPAEAGWNATRLWLALDVSDAGRLQRLTVRENDVETELYPAETALEDAGPDALLGLPAFSAAGLVAGLTPDEVAEVPEPSAETFRYYQAGQAEAVDGIYELDIVFDWQDGESETQTFIFLIDTAAPTAPVVTAQPGTQQVVLAAEAGPSGHGFLMAVDGEDYLPLEGDSCVLEGPGSYRFVACSGAGVVSEPVVYVVPEAEAPGTDAEGPADPDEPADPAQPDGQEPADGEAGVIDGTGEPALEPPTGEGQQAVPATPGDAGDADAAPQDEAGLQSGGVAMPPEPEPVPEPLPQPTPAPTPLPTTGTWVSSDDGVLYYAPDGKVQSGWLLLEGKRYYLDPAANHVRATGVRMVDGVWYSFANTGEVLPGVHTLPETAGAAGRFYTGADFVTHVGWLDHEGVRYHAGADGVFLLGVQQIEASWYNLHSETGAVQPGWATAPNGERYYTNDDFTLNHGWLSADGKRYYMHPETGVMLTGWQQVDSGYVFLEESSGVVRRGWLNAPDGKKYYVRKSYEVAKGWLKVDGKTYYMHAETGAMQKGWLELDGKKYYLASSGERVTGQKKIGGSYYRFDTKGAMKAGWFTAADGKRYYTQKESWTNAKGWLDVGAKRYYCDPKTGAQVTGTKKIDGSWVVLDPQKNGALQYGWVTSPSNKNARYYTDKATRENAKGWLKIGKKLYYFNEKTGRVKTGKAKVDGVWYQFDAKTGAVKTKTIITTKEGSYYMTGKHVYAKGWVTHQKKRYYADPETGRLVTGLNRVNDLWYEMDSSGVVKTKHVLKTPDGLYYMTTKYKYGSGWQRDAAGKRYYADKETKLLATGKNKIGGTWYSMSTKTGAVKAGWVTAEGNKYYIKADGKPATGTMVIKGVSYNFDKYGKLLKEISHGIDVSVYQGRIDWAAVAASGQVDFAIMRALTWEGDAATGGYALDTTFDYNVREAKKHGIMVGAYLFSYAFTDAEMAVEINYFINHPMVKKLKADGYLFDLPIFIDFEWEEILKRTDSHAQRTQMLRHGMVMLDNAGYTPGFYSSYNWAKNYYNATQLQAEGYPFWYAYYKENQDHSNHGWSPTPALWQYTSDGSIPGISGRVDMNHCYATYHFKTIKK